MNRFNRKEDGERKRQTLSSPCRDHVAAALSHLSPAGAARCPSVHKENHEHSRQYELVYIVTPDASEQEVADLHTQIEQIVQRFNGTLDKTENWGRRKLAYEIGHHREGTYVVETITGSGELMKEIDRRLRVIDQVIRHLVVRVDEELRVAERTRDARKTFAGAAPRRARPAAGARSRAKAAATDRTRTTMGRDGGAAMREERGGGGRGRGGDKDKRTARAATRRGGGFFRRRRVCKFCAEKIDYINYKDVRLLAPFLPERGKIQPRRISGTCALHQRKLQTAIKRARQLGVSMSRTSTRLGRRGQIMEVILREHVDNLGRRGEIVKVADGLRPQLPAAAQAGAGGDRGEQAADRARAAAAEARELEEKSQAEAFAARLDLRPRSRSPAASARTTPCTGRSPRPTSRRR